MLSVPNSRGHLKRLAGAFLLAGYLLFAPSPAAAQEAAAAPHAPSTIQDPFGFERLDQLLDTFPMQFGRTIAGRPMRNPTSSAPRPRVPVVGVLPWLWQPTPPAVVSVPMVFPAAQPQVTIHQHFQAESKAPVQPPPPSPPVKAYTAPERAVVPSQQSAEAASPASKVFLLAFTDNTLVSAYAYWLEGDFLYYVATDRTVRQAPLAHLDREFTARVNRMQGMPWLLPAADSRR